MPAVSARTVVEWALQIEANGEAFYRAVAAKATHRDAKTILEDLAYQQARHYHVFQRMLNRLPPTEQVETGRQEAEAYLRGVLSHALLEGDQGVELARQAASEEEALKTAMAFEKDTLLFFYDVLERVPAEQRKAVEAVIAEEKRHLQELAAALEQGLWVG